MRITVFCMALSLAAVLAAGEAVRLPASARNLLVEAKVSGNLEGYKLGLRGRPDHMVYDIQRGRFLKDSQWHEYGVGFGKSLGVVPEDEPAWWMAQWPKPVAANLIVLSGVYPNQPQPETRWKIELRQGGQWTTHARGQGGWYDRGRYVWGGHGTEAKAFDALRVSVFSKDATTTLESIHFRGEKGLSWVVARLLPFDARIRLPGEPIRVGQEVEIAAEVVAGEVKTWAWDFGDGKAADTHKVTHIFTKAGEQRIKLTFGDGEHDAAVKETVTVLPPVAARIAPLSGPVMAGKPVELVGSDACGNATAFAWDLGDGNTADQAR
ncbi:MAG: PKD domain-containing protein, partial [Planctomycetota bacterium]